VLACYNTMIPHLGPSCPGSYHQTAMRDFPVSLGDYRFSGGPGNPIVAHLERAPIVPGAGLTPREQYLIGRHELLAMHRAVEELPS